MLANQLVNCYILYFMLIFKHKVLCLYSSLLATSCPLCISVSFSAKLFSVFIQLWKAEFLGCVTGESPRKTQASNSFGRTIFFCQIERFCIIQTRIYKRKKDLFQPYLKAWAVKKIAQRKAEPLPHYHQRKNNCSCLVSYSASPLLILILALPWAQKAPFYPCPEYTDKCSNKNIKMASLFFRAPEAYRL